MGEPKAGAIAGIKRLFAPLTKGGDQAKQTAHTGLDHAYESVTQIAALMNERMRLTGLEQAETNKLDGLAANLKAMDSERILALTEFRVSGRPEANERAQSLLKQCSEVGQEMDDARAVAGGINARIQDLNYQIKTLSVRYRVDLGAFLTMVYGRLIDRYNEAAPEVAEIALQLAATRRVMARYLAGNSNGWDGRILLPGMKAGEGRTIAPMVDGDSRGFDSGASGRMDDIIDEMKAAGFIWHLE